MSATRTPRRRLALRLAAAGALAAIPLAVVALPANAAAPDDSGAPVVAQQVDDHGPWDNDRDHHDRDRHRHDHDGDWNGGNGWDGNAPVPAPAPWQPPTGSFGSS